jgi:hypothetical protein
LNLIFLSGRFFFSSQLGTASILAANQIRRIFFELKVLASTFLRPGSRQFRLTVVFCRPEFHALCVFLAETAALADNLLKVDSEPESSKQKVS